VFEIFRFFATGVAHEITNNLTQLARVAEFNPQSKQYKNVQHQKIDNFLEKFGETLVNLNSVIPDLPRHCLSNASSLTGQEGLQFFLFFIRTLIVRILHQAEGRDR
jgi:uncharacterized membrane protein YdjX (TVP38/TMEM64 family)